MPVLESQIEKVETDDRIHEADRSPIQQFVEAEQGRKADSTVAQYCVNLRTLSRRSETPLIEASFDDIQNLLDRLAAGTHDEVKDSGIQVQPHASVLSRFGEYHDLPFDYAEFDFEPSKGRDLNPDELLYQEDVDALLEACGMDIRYKALITWGLATGQRLDALRTIRIKHVTFEGGVGDIQLNVEEGALKGASGTVPMFWAKHYLREWLDIHPFPDNPEAAVFCSDPRMNTRDEARTDPLSQSSIRHKLNNLEEKANLNKNLYPHLLRHSAATRMALEGMSDQSIKSVMNWSGDSSQFETYVSLADDLRNDSLREELDLPTSDADDPVVGKPTLDKCGNPECRDEYPPKYDQCPTCGGQPESKTPGVEEMTDAVDDLNEEDTAELLKAIAKKTGVDL